MKKLFILFLLCWCSCVYSAPVKKLVFFGDSLSDDGNLYKLLFHYLPKSPPYFNGRFSNGTTWAENVAKIYYDKAYVSYINYSLGGATALLKLPTSKFISPTNLELEINNYLVDALFKSKSDSLFSIWIGGNDYVFDDNSNVNQLTDRVVGKISWAIRRLIWSGGKYFLILNLPDLSRIPIAVEKSKNRLRSFSELHNKKLEREVDEIKKKNPQVTIVYLNIYDLFNDVIDHPQIYNAKYGINITNVSNGCWQGGYWFKSMGLDKDSSRLLTSSLNDHKAFPPDLYKEGISDFILNSPELLYTYRLGVLISQGLEPCSNANEYLFWDQIHPTEVVHRILSFVVKQSIDAEQLI